MTLAVLPRSAWRPVAGLFSRPLISSRVRGVVLHWPGTGRGYGEDPDVVARALRGFDAFHKRSRGWPGIGYLSASDQAGRIWLCQGSRVGAHSATQAYPLANHERWGHLLLLGPGENPSNAMRTSVAELRAALIEGDFPDAPAFHGALELHGHRHMRGADTECPGDPAVRTITTGGFSTITPVGGDHAARAYAPGEVSKIKQVLAWAGFFGGDPFTDAYTRELYDAVVAYQSGQVWPALIIDGDWGPQCWQHAIWTEQLQEALNEWKTSLPRLKVDRDYGDLTDERFAEWQRRNHGGAYRGALDRVPGPISCAALGIPEHP